MRTILLVTLICFSLGACKEKIKDTVELREMNAVLAELNKTKGMLDSIDFKQYDQIKKKVTQDILWIQENLHDTLTRQHSILISNYARIAGKRGIGTAIKKEDEPKTDAGYDKQRKDFIRKELDLCINQLENLKHDTENKIIITEEVRQFLKTEKENSEKIITYVRLERSKSLNAREIADSLGPQIAHFIDSLKMKQKP